MKNCVGIADLLCAYADGELPESNKKIVEDHLAICENCSAILKMYSEISSSVSDTSVPAPDALRIGVMNRIQGEKISTEDEKKYKWWHHKVILTRYAPIAACIVVMLIVWQYWGTMRDGNLASQDAARRTGSAGAPEAAGGAADSEMAGFTLDVGDMKDAETGGGAFDEPGIGGWAIDEPGFTLDNMPVATPAPSPDEDFAALYIDDVMASLFANNEFAWRAFDVIDNNSGEYSEYIRNAYAVIVLTGDLPLLLEGTQPHPYSSLEIWEMLIEIPNSLVDELMLELNDREGATVAYNDSDSKYSIVVIFHENNG